MMDTTFIIGSMGMMITMLVGSYVFKIMLDSINRMDGHKQ